MANLEDCEPITPKTGRNPSTIPWQYAPEQGEESSATVKKEIDEAISTKPDLSAMVDTLAQKWWLESLPSGLPYTQYLKDTYTAENEMVFNSGVVPDYIKTHEALLEADKLVYNGLEGNPVGSVNGDPMLSPDWKWNDRRYSAMSFSGQACGGAVDSNGLFCYNTQQIDWNLLSGLALSAASAKHEVETTLNKIKTDTLKNISAISAEFIASANDRIYVATTAMNHCIDIISGILATPSAFSSGTSASNTKKVSNAINSYKSANNENSVKIAASKMAADAMETMETEFVTLATVNAAASESESNAAAALNEVVSLLPIKIPKIEIPDFPVEILKLVMEAAMPIPWEPPEPLMKIEIDWWQWLMDNLTTILNKAMTTLMVNIGIVIPVHIAGGIMAACPLSDFEVVTIQSAGPPGTMHVHNFFAPVADAYSVDAIAACVKAAGAALNTTWFEDVPIFWTFPPIFSPSPSVNIEAPDLMSFLDPEPAEFIQKAVDVLYEGSDIMQTELLSMVNDLIPRGGSESSVMIDSEKLKARVAGRVKTEYDALKEFYTNHNCPYSLALLERYHSQQKPLES